MEDRKVSLLAAAFGSVAIGGFWLARPTPGRAPLRVEEQRALPPGGIGLDDDAAVVFRVRLPGPVRDAMSEGQSVVFRVADRAGRVYPVLPMADPLLAGTLKLTTGYAHRAESPRLEAWSSGTLLASCPLADLPPPADVPLVPEPDPPLRLVYQGGQALGVEARRPLPKGERWRVFARRTRHALAVRGMAEVPFRNLRGGPDRLLLAYPQEAEAVEVEIQRYRFEKYAMTVSVPGLCLRRRHGGTALVVARSFSIPNGMGATVMVPAQDIGPHRNVRNDRRIASANVVIVPHWQTESPESGFRRTRGPRVEILSPSPESLGLRELWVGGGVRAARRNPDGPLKEGPFVATLRVTFDRPVLVGRRTAVLPVEIAPKPWPAPFPMGYGGR